MNLKSLSPLIPVVMLPLGIWLGYRAFGEYEVAEILAAVAEIPARNLTFAFLFAAASYLCLTGFDALAVRAAGRSLPYPKVALTSFVSLSIGHNVGVAALSSGALRYRFYSGFGLDAADVAKIVLYCAVTVTLGMMTLGGIALLLRPGIAADLTGIGAAPARAGGVVCLLLSAAYVLAAFRVRRPWRIRGHELSWPEPRIAAAQVAVGTANFACVAAVLHQLLAGAIGYLDAVAIYLLGGVAAILSHVPGGLGVLEYVIASLVPDGNVVGALIALRIVYFFVPLALGATLLAGAEIARWHARAT